MSTRNAASNPWAQGITIFAASMLAIVGFVQIFQGIAAIAKDDVLVRTQDYVYAFNTTTWGWIHLVLGVLLIVIAFAIMSGNAFARGAGIGIAILSIIANFLWLPYYPIWAVVIIAFDVVVIWALTAYSADFES
ncbi:hypothetical protein KV097_11545 [Mumia sp. zg.B17]|uniref:DUF7144 family membrane protein n=1 Tax=unclassified Mumia TaxID=2621872 RepID=UPI001C6F5CDF|nr:MULTISPECIES: hypothetical protein [unclassified Mumia]MBW9206575.1 hypothetical protein [Mumia sp. zg.B17]MBW9211135.1 hypothetical protein [Mumia sp. zg.B21]MDD9349322.1 hypothetical protein [Mumia sp.]